MLVRPAWAIAALLVLVACQAPGAATIQPTPSASTSSSAEESASATESASASAATSACLDEDVIAAIDELDSGNLDTTPALTEIADALDTLELDGDQASARDGLVTQLRADPVNETGIVSAVLNLKANVDLQAC